MPYDPEEQVNWKLLASSDDHVTRNGTDIPAWFDMELSREGWPTEIVLSVVVDQQEGPVINGIRGGRTYRHGYQQVVKFFRENTDPAVFLRFVTAYAAGVLATRRVLEEHAPDITARGDALKAATAELNDHFARRAWPATVVQRRRRMTRELLEKVAEVYRTAYGQGLSPTKAVAEAFDVSHSSAGRWVVEARKEGLLGPALGPTAGEAETPTASE